MSNVTEVIRLFDAGKTPPQIASILDVPEDAVHRLLASRRRLLDNPHVGVAREIFRKLANEAASDAGADKENEDA